MSSDNDNKDNDNNYPLSPGECEVKCRGRTGPKPSKISAHLKDDLTVRMDCSNNPEFWVEFQIPIKYIITQYEDYLSNSDDSIVVETIGKLSSLRLSKKRKKNLSIK